MGIVNMNKINPVGEIKRRKLADYQDKEANQKPGERLENGEERILAGATASRRTGTRVHLLKVAPPAPARPPAARGVPLPPTPPGAEKEIP